MPWQSVYRVHDVERVLLGMEHHVRDEGHDGNYAHGEGHGEDGEAHDGAHGENHAHDEGHDGGGEVHDGGHGGVHDENCVLDEGHDGVHGESCVLGEGHDGGLDGVHDENCVLDEGPDGGRDEGHDEVHDENCVLDEGHDEVHDENCVLDEGHDGDYDEGHDGVHDENCVLDEGHDGGRDVMWNDRHVRGHECRGAHDDLYLKVDLVFLKSAEASYVPCLIRVVVTSKNGYHVRVRHDYDRDDFHDDLLMECAYHDVVDDVSPNCCHGDECHVRVHGGLHDYPLRALYLLLYYLLEWVVQIGFQGRRFDQRLIVLG